jgi:hypothetical protein
MTRTRAAIVGAIVVCVAVVAVVGGRGGRELVRQ